MTPTVTSRYDVIGIDVGANWNNTGIALAVDSTFGTPVGMTV